MPREAYEHLQEKLSKIEALESKTEEYTVRFLEEDQTLPPELDALAKEDPELHLSTLKSMEQETIQELRYVEIENPEEMREYLEFLKFAGACKVQTSIARSKLVQALNNLEKQTKKEYKQKLKKIRKTKEEITN